MKLLMIYCERFAYKPVNKSLSDFPDITEGGVFEDALVAFIQTEEQDMQNSKPVETKLVKNLKWGAKKNNTRKVVLHSFAHLSESKADPHFTKELFDAAEARMKNADYECEQTPFGYFLDIDVKAPGISQARIFKSF
ncbi:threonyl-tRNA synthetase editing domain-containing protein [Candidatus Sulfidibacterium hydrothermale]|uniref:threonyl-tRNA synthetase editing domain-containing protein n=1 Tax=Candidatus Sulfidibacterium hydrothermale TaxID=2875962 RepID=UPI001F0B37F1|nr:threonyl-tRNA synthetase editing domain-containing protein [Candidatus Sulfidibacterium hydrothermale]UBM61448.1 threonyl-tRNA synthetase editing domain-containing protein [Candidatus Sulfidibacterium hydrothermale]